MNDSRELKVHLLTLPYKRTFYHSLCATAHSYALPSLLLLDLFIYVDVCLLFCAENKFHSGGYLWYNENNVFIL